MLVTWGCVCIFSPSGFLIVQSVDKRTTACAVFSCEVEAIYPTRRRSTTQSLKKLEGIAVFLLSSLEFGD